jgi:ribose transport system ATP-binding protein
MNATLRLTDISKSFGSIRVLERVNLEAFPGEVHILAGENGAGKSTLMKILAGVYSQYDGTIELSGVRAEFSSPHDASVAGISVIHQEMSLIPAMSVLDNLFLGRKLSMWSGRRQKAELALEAHALCKSLDLEIDLDQPIEQYSIAVRNQIEILKALTFKSRVLVMDEPSSALGASEVEKMFGLIDQLKKNGCAIIYISHRMEEIYRLADRITVLRDGKSVGTALASDLPEPKLIEWMIGRELKNQFPHRSRVARSEPGLVARNFHGVDFEVGAGEILGIAGLQGSGKSELIQALYTPEISPHVANMSFYVFRRSKTHKKTYLPRRGEIHIAGKPFEVRSPEHSIKQGLALLTNDRKETGLCLGMSVSENLTLSRLKDFSRLGFIRKNQEKSAALRAMKRLRVKCNDLTQAVGELSGGNQQKVALGKCIETSPKVLLLDEPTRGVDVGAKHEIYELIFELAAQGSAIVLITSEMPECLALSDRIMVMHRGRKSAIFTKEEATQEKILKAAMGEA